MAGFQQVDSDRFSGGSNWLPILGRNLSTYSYSVSMVVPDLLSRPRASSLMDVFDFSISVLGRMMTVLYKPTNLLLD